MIKCIFKSYGFFSFPCGESPLDWISTGLGAVGIGANFASQSDANSTNLQATRETNEMNYKIHQEDIQHQIDMFNRTNEYNTPEQQVSRLRAAGINPSAVLGSDGQRAGVSAVMPSVPAAPQMLAGHVNPIDLSPSLKVLQDSVSQMFQNQNIDLQNQEKRFELLHMEERFQLDMAYKKAEIDEKLANKDLSKAERDKLVSEKESIQQNIDLHNRIKDDLVKKYRLDNDRVEQETNKIRAEEEAQKLQNAYQEWFNEFSKKHGSAQLALIAAQIKDALASVNLSDKNAELAVRQKIESLARQHKINFDMVEQRQLNRLLRRSIRLEQRQQGSDFWNPFRYVGTILGGPATAATKAILK